MKKRFPLERESLFAKGELASPILFTKGELASPILRASCRIRTNDPEITNHVLWPTELKRRVGSCLYRAATTKYPCYVPILGDSEGAGRTGLPVFSQKAGDKISASRMQRARSMLRRSLISQTICKNRLQR